MIEPDNSLPANRAFVIQFRPAARDGWPRFEGRVEHLASGHAEYFSSSDELWKLLVHLLRHKPQESGNDIGRPGQ